MTNSEKMNQLYEHLLSAHDGPTYTMLDQSLNPRSLEMLYDLADKMNITPQSTLLDAGSGRGYHAFNIARRHRCRVIGVEVASHNIDLSVSDVANEELRDQISFCQGRIESLPLVEAAVDFVWCRDMLVHVEALEKALQACARVLKPGGLMLILTSFATDLLFAGEVEEFFEPLAIVPRNLEPGTFDAALNEAGFRIEYSDDMGGEGLEHTEEQSQRYSKELLRLSRMSRRPEQLIEVLGQRQFDIARSLYYWSIFLLIGKLTNTIYLVRK